MAVETAEDLAVFFNSNEWGVAATYTPPGGGAATPCTILIDYSDRDLAAGLGRPIMQGITVAVRKSEIATPEREGIFSVGGSDLTVQGDPTSDDTDRAIWTCTVA